MDYKITNKFGAEYGELGPKGEKCPIPHPPYFFSFPFMTVNYLRKTPVRAYKRVKLTKDDMIIEMMNKGMSIGRMFAMPKKSVEVHYNRMLDKISRGESVFDKRKFKTLA